jgi:hypothetical protein
MRERRFSLGLRLALALPLLGTLWLFLESERAHGSPLRWAAGASYALALVVVLRRLRRGELLDPAVCLAGSYLLLLALGALVYEALRESALSAWAFHAIGAGHAALWTGLLLAGRAPAERPPTPPVSITSRQGAQLLLLALLACLGATAVLFATYGGIPLLAADPDEARIAILSGRGELAIFLVGLGLLAYAGLHDARTRGIPAWRAHALALLTFLVLLALGGRARALLFALGYGGLELLLRPRALRLGVLALGGTAALALLALVGAWRRGGSLAPGEALAELGIGALALPTMVARLEQRLEPGSLAAGPWSDLATLLPGEDHGANVELKYAVFENWRALPASAGVNPSVIGEGWIHFGSAGVVLEPFLLGLVSALLWRHLARARGFLGPALYACWITGMMAAVSAGVGIRLTHFVQQLAWLALLAPFCLVRCPVRGRARAGSNPSGALARVAGSP